MSSYENGFMDALLLVEHLALKTGDQNFIKRVTHITEELKSCIVEKRVEKLKDQLGLI